jgi:ketosteroid isomerase-like protein
MAHAHAEILRAIDEAQAKGDIEAFFAAFTDDVKVHVQGNNKLAGEYTGKDQPQDFFDRFMEAAGEGYSFENHGYLADDEHGVTFQTSHFSRESRSLDLDETFIVHFRDGKISELWYLPLDAAALDACIGR